MQELDLFYDEDAEMYDVSSPKKTISLSPMVIHMDLDLNLRLGVADMTEACADAATCGLPREIVEHILSLLDRKSLARSKLLSREWNMLICARSHLPIQVTHSGIVLQGPISAGDDNRRVCFLQLDCSGKANLHAPPSLRNVGEDFLLLDSCSGLLLFKVTGPIEELCVYDPISNMVQFVPILFAILSKLAVVEVHGLIVDGLQNQVVSILVLPKDEALVKLISARSLELLPVKLPSGVSTSGLEMNPSVFFLNRRVYCCLCNWLLVYDLMTHRFNFWKLPHGRKASVYPRHLWRSEGKLYYGIGRLDKGFQIWWIVPELEGPCDINIGDWGQAECLLLETLVAGYPEIFGTASSDTTDFYIRPSAFNDDFQILYLELPGMIAAYHLKTRTFSKAFSLSDNVYSLWAYRFCTQPFKFSKNHSSYGLFRP